MRNFTFCTDLEDWTLWVQALRELHLSTCWNLFYVQVGLEDKGDEDSFSQHSQAHGTKAHTKCASEKRVHRPDTQGPRLSLP